MRRMFLFAMLLALCAMPLGSLASGVSSAVVRLPVSGSASSMIDCPSGAVPTNNARFLASTYLVSAPSSNSAAGTNGQVAITVLGGTNFVYFYDPNGGGAGTGRWVRTEGSVTW